MTDREWFWQAQQRRVWVRCYSRKCRADRRRVRLLAVGLAVSWAAWMGICLWGLWIATA